MPLSIAPPTWAPTMNGWYRRTARDLPWRRPEFHEQYGAWGTLVSEFMLQQTPVARVIPHLEAWLERWPTPAAMSRATPAEVVHQWANLGYPRRALWLHRAGTEVVERHDGVVPRRWTLCWPCRASATTPPAPSRCSATAIGIRWSTPTRAG
ncbi:hypothetical protein GCM10025863_12250 [Microbacterium suwonense]|uniref:HhH-GPD domain-containing protein n=1 Tax=Microbacterium suwonense TaxID=683047 RepID=A0ABM8FT52_9MICO|nr:hypothetical protein GCM10025863_12250 [Microbacterium suwonense]